jgi:hypothetical protein
VLHQTVTPKVGPKDKVRQKVIHFLNDTFFWEKKKGKKEKKKQTNKTK